MIVLYWAIGIAVTALVLRIGFVWCRYWWRVGADIGQSVRNLSVPMPTPYEIESALCREWHRPPTVQEVAAVEQMLHNQRNRDLVNAGMGFGALYLIARSM